MRRHRAGFTLLEVMFATAIFSIVAASLATFFIGVQRLSRRATATAELSLAMRELREKLLFHAQPPDDEVVRSGLLSGAARGPSPIEAGIKVLVDAPVFTLDGAAVSLGEIQLLNDSGRFKNDGATDPWRTLWFRFGGSVEGGASSGLAYLGDDVFEDGVASLGLFFLNLSASEGGVVHGERIAVPLFGVEQVKNSTSVFHDNLLATP
jgi:prepilin-type N-terminal cleavage/methylation domain-containing protein